MACLTNITLMGLQHSCEANLAGIKKVYLGYFDDFTITPSESGHTATIEAVEGGEGKLYPYTFAKRTGSLTSTLTKDETNGVRYYTHSINLQFNKMEAKKHLEMEAMAAESLIAIVVDNNNKSWIVGVDGYVSTSAQTAQTGQGYDELNGYTLTLDCMSAHLPYEITEADYSSLVQTIA
jgi:hypothetical protein